MESFATCHSDYERGALALSLYEAQYLCVIVTVNGDEIRAAGAARPTIMSISIFASETGFSSS
jgi:hypothetical protein